MADAAESALDGYRLKPRTAQSLLERIQHARQRKPIFEDILLAVADGQLALAAQL